MSTEPSSRVIRVAIIDDHELVRDGLRHAIQQHAHMEVCGEAEDTESGLRLVSSARPDVAIVDISLKEGSALDLIKDIKIRCPDVKVVVSSMHDEELFAERALHAGALGYVHKQQGSRVFVRARKKAGDCIAAAVVLEMVGYTSPEQHYPFILQWAGYPEHGEYIGVIGDWRSRRFGRAVLKGFRSNPKLPVESLFVPFRGWVLPVTRLSDHASFWDAGFPALMVTDTAFMRNPNYHLPGDTIETLDFRFMAELVKSLELAVAEFPVLPDR